MGGFSEIGGDEIIVDAGAKERFRAGLGGLFLGVVDTIGTGLKLKVFFGVLTAGGPGAGVLLKASIDGLVCGGTWTPST